VAAQRTDAQATNRLAPQQGQEQAPPTHSVHNRQRRTTGQEQTPSPLTRPTPSSMPIQQRAEVSPKPRHVRRTHYRLLPTDRRTVLSSPPDPGPSSIPLEWDKQDGWSRLTGDVQDRVDFAPVDRAKQPARLRCRHGNQLDPSNLRLLPQLRHDWKLAACSGSHHQSWRRPRDTLVGRQRRVAILVAIRFGWSLLPGANTTRFHHHVMVEAVAIDRDDAKTRVGNVHVRTIRPTESPCTNRRQWGRRQCAKWDTGLVAGANGNRSVHVMHVVRIASVAGVALSTSTTPSDDDAPVEDWAVRIATL